MLIKPIVGLVGLGTEAYAYRKQKKETKQSNVAILNAEDQHVTIEEASVTSSDAFSTRQSPYADDEERSLSSQVSLYQSNDADWVCDEAQHDIEADDTLPSTTVAKSFSQTPAPTGKKLSHPVVLPQRRPESRSHGFVRAYAPELNECGIDEATFLKFLEDFTGSMKGSGYFNAVNIAIAASVLSYTASAASVNPAVHVAALCVHTSIEAGRRLKNIHQINTFLETMNEVLFKPRGLYVMLMTYKPNSSSSTIPVDVNENILTSVYSRTLGDRSKLRSASGVSHGEIEMPECAPLVFPAFSSTGIEDEKKKNALKRAGAFVSEYKDRQASAQFRHNNPDSVLNVGEPEKFASVFSDPNHPMNKGGGLNTLSGGYLFKGAQVLQRKGMRAAVPFKLDRQMGKEGSGVGGTQGRAIKRLIGENVLYLMVVNMPSEEELEEVSVWEAEMKKKEGVKESYGNTTSEKYPDEKHYVPKATAVPVA